MANWPTLPKPIQSGYQETPPDLTIRTTMDTGPVKVRRRFTAGYRIFSLTYHLTKSEATTLDNFYVTTTMGGAIEFTWTNPRTDASCTARFVSAPIYTNSDYEVDAKVQIEVLP